MEKEQYKKQVEKSNHKWKNYITLWKLRNNFNLVFVITILRSRKSSKTIRVKPFESLRTTLLEIPWRRRSSGSGFATIGSHDPEEGKWLKHSKKQNPEIKMVSFLDYLRWVRSIMKQN
jgi:hypothetical protein